MKFQISHTAIVLADISSGAREIEEKNQMDYIELKSFHMGKENIITMKRDPTLWENIFAYDTLDKGLISKIYNELTQLHSRRQTTQ